MPWFLNEITHKSGKVFITAVELCVLIPEVTWRYGTGLNVAP